MMGENGARRASDEEAAMDHFFEELIDKLIREHFKDCAIVNIFPGPDIVMTETGVWKYECNEGVLEIYLMETKEWPAVKLKLRWPGDTPAYSGDQWGDEYFKCKLKDLLKLWELRRDSLQTTADSLGPGILKTSFAEDAKLIDIPITELKKALGWGV